MPHKMEAFYLLFDETNFSSSLLYHAISNKSRYENKNWSSEWRRAHRVNGKAAAYFFVDFIDGEILFLLRVLSRA
jgi:hypothetical protein